MDAASEHPKPRDGFASPRFAQPATFMRLPHRHSPAGLDVALCGIPFDGGCSYRSGARMGPRHVREHSSLIRPWNSALRVHPFDRLSVADCGDVDRLIDEHLARVHARLVSLSALERQLQALRKQCGAQQHTVATCGILHELVSAAQGERCVCHAVPVVGVKSSRRSAKRL